MVGEGRCSRLGVELGSSTLTRTVYLPPVVGRLGGLWGVRSGTPTVPCKDSPSYDSLGGRRAVGSGRRD